MKTIQSIAGLFFLLISITSIAQDKATVKSENIKVWGNCGMCKTNIEKAAKSAGASYASWNKDTKVLAVKFESSKTSSQQIQEKVAATGYDTKDLKGDDKAYNELDECCKYDRKPAATKTTPAKQK